MPQIDFQSQNIPFSVNLPTAKALPDINISSNGVSALQDMQSKEIPSVFDVIKFLSENLGADAMKRTPVLRNHELIFDKLRTDFLSDFDKKIFAELEKMPKADKKKDGIIEWLEKDDETYGLMGNHTYELRKYDKANDVVYLINPHDSEEMISVPYNYYVNSDGDMDLCNLEESEE